MRLWQTKSKVEAAEAKYQESTGVASALEYCEYCEYCEYQESTGVASALEYCEYVLRAVGTDLWLCFLPPVGAAEGDGCAPGPAQQPSAHSATLPMTRLRGGTA
jgi:hypothetical protein